MPVAPSRSGSRSCARTLPEPPSLHRARLQADWAFSDLEMRDVVGAGAMNLVAETVAAGACTASGQASGGCPSSRGAPTSTTSPSTTYR
ncbi:MAG: hypothetical protein WKF83_03660 [Nocardioidaceae bacterium]